MKFPIKFRLRAAQVLFLDMGIRTKMLMVMAPLVVVLVFLSITGIMDKMKRRSSMEELESLTAVAVLSNSLIRSLQKERYLTAIYLMNSSTISSHHVVDRDLHIQHLVSNNRLTVLQMYMRRTYFSPEKQTFVALIKTALKKLENFSSTRKKLLRGQTTSLKILHHYSEVIDGFLAGIAVIPMLHQISTISTPIHAYVNILQAGERYENRNAIQVSIRSHEIIDRELIDRRRLLKSEEKIFWTRFKMYAATESNLQFPENSALLMQMEDKIAYKLSERADSLKSRAGAVLILYILLLFFLLIGSVFFAYILNYSIVRPVRFLSAKMSEMDDLNFSIEKPSDRKDEIGNLHTRFYSLGLKLKYVLAGLEETVQKRTEELHSINDKLSRYLPPQLYESIFHGSHEVSLGHKRKKLTIFFSDIVGFTVATERMDPEDLSALLNSYLEEMSKIAIKWGGTIDKFIGDSIMIFFGDPQFTSDRDHALRCIRMALEMKFRLNEMRDIWSYNGLNSTIRIRIGINTGYCTVGNFGSDNRMDYTIIGRQVNLASRLETAAEPDSILISESVYQLIRNEIQCVYKGERRFKGIDLPARVYEALNNSDAPDRKERFLEVGSGYRIELDPHQLSNDEKIFARKMLRRAYQLTLGKSE